MGKIVFIALNTILLVLVVGILWSYSREYKIFCVNRKKEVPSVE